jgi:hypothetical protein
MQTLLPLIDCVGARLRRVRRIWFAHGGHIDRHEGPLELTFDSGTTLLLNGAGDGQGLVLRTQRWEDPFGDGPDLDPETAAWIAEHGKWSAVDVSSEQDMAVLIGKSLRSITELRTDDGQTCGARLQFNGAVVDVAVIADELRVLVGGGNERTLADSRVFLGRGPITARHG